MRQRNKPKRRSAKAVLRLPDLDHSKSSVLQSLGSVASQRTYARDLGGMSDRAKESVEC
jgi:hypothetical protein